jgi:hypothetical protein
MGFPKRTGVSAASETIGLRTGGAGRAAVRLAAAARTGAPVSMGPAAGAGGSCLRIASVAEGEAARTESVSTELALKAAKAAAASAIETTAIANLFFTAQPLSQGRNGSAN